MKAGISDKKTQKPILWVMALLKTDEPIRKNVQPKKVLPNQFLHFSTQGGETVAITPAFHPDKQVGTVAPLLMPKYG
ncbi:MAG: hypothetical protein EA359_09455 [Balneolaceae bacterium]|nr:MAG: hypothetical protein EA359_09455 [Balneolaceae bacterium]